MSTFRKVIVVTVLVAAALLPAQPASAAPDTCTFSGEMTTSTSFVTFPFPFAQGDFTIGATLGGCIAGHTTLGGVIGGWCYLANGWGTFGGHHKFIVDWRAGTLTFSGQVVGTLTISPNALNGQSCTAGASGFLVSGTLTLV